MDYCDWKAILSLRKKGFHYLPEGKVLIERILQQMNNNRLSTSQQPRIDRTLLMVEIDKLLSRPSNYEIRDGKTYIKSLNRYAKYISESQAVQLVDSQNNKIVSTFNSYNECAKFLGCGKSTVASRLTKGNSFLYRGKLVFLKKCSSSIE